MTLHDGAIQAFVFESHVHCLYDLKIQFAFLCEQNGPNT